MTTYMFPGQGSQSKGMGAALFAEFPDLVNKADTILGYSITKLCLEDPEQQLGKTNFTQPALFVVNALSYLKRRKEDNVLPNYVIGHSLGEYNSLFAAEVFDFETGLRLVKKRGELMAQASGGGMAAVVGLQADQVQALIAQHQLNNISIANYNSATQAVISGPKEAILAAEKIFTGAGAMLYMPLNVSGAFHSPYMDAAQTEFKTFVSQFSFGVPKIPVIANVNAQPYQADQIATNLTSQITHSVQWTQMIKYLITNGETNFIEIGPGKILTGLVKRIQKGQ